ncbi:hypothetical protein CBER1_05086 [Cercospora berteroae]|uniref:Uncharacterized protein n=1 Tax=Cercospora berteroae TaxID=357750 RepID=A0A2S6CNN1_9PEZI|nr:hypothetical protein CBER1_05086 [Cercospora berteroae]
MRYSVLALAPFVAAAYAQDTNNNDQNNDAQTSSTSISIPPYSNTMTNFLTQTNSNGVVTGMPTPQVGGQGVAETSIPPVATIPAGLAPGSVYTLFYGNETSFTVSVASSTTIVVGPGGSQATDVSVTTGNNAATPSSASGNENATETSENGSTETSDSAASGNLKVASGAMFGLGALLAFAL